MQVAQISQRRSIFIVHPAREVRIVQPLVARRFRHILQHAQSLLNRLPALRRHLPPSRQHFIAHMVLLLRRHLLPDLRSLAQLLLLLWRKLLESPLILLESPAFLRREVSRTPRCIRRTVPIKIRPLNALPSHVRRAIPSVARVSRSSRWRVRCARIARCIEVAARRFSITARRFGNPPLRLRPARFLLWLAALLPLLLPSLLVWLLPLFLLRLIFLTALRPIRARILRRALQRQSRADHQRQQPSAELEPQFHRALHILTLLICVVSWLRLRQFRQRLEARDHIVVFEHGYVGLINLRRIGHGIPANPHRRQQQQRSRKRHSRRRRKPCPPALLRRFRCHACSHAQIKRLRWLDHRQFIQQRMHRAKFIHAQLARPARREMLLHLQPFAFFQAPVHVSQNLVFHPAATHNFLPSLPRVYCLVRCATSGASSTRNVSYARNSSDFSALSEHSKIFEISP